MSFDSIQKAAAYAEAQGKKHGLLIAIVATAENFVVKGDDPASRNQMTEHVNYLTQETANINLLMQAVDAICAQLGMLKAANAQAGAA